MHDYHDLEVVGRTRRLLPRVYEVTATYPAEERYVLVSQTRRAAHSIGANLAEGAGRRTSGEFRQFVSQAAGSAFELEWHFTIAADLRYITPSQRDAILTEIVIIKKLLYRFGETLK